MAPAPLRLSAVVLVSLAACGAQEVLLSSSDLESLLMPASEVVSPQGLIIVRRSTITQSEGATVSLDMEENLSVFDEEDGMLGVLSSPSQLLGTAVSMLSSMLSAAPQPERLVATRYDDDGSHADSAARDFECPCGRDVAALCEPSERAADDYSEFATVYEKRLCLARNRAEVSPSCSQHLAEAPTVVEYCYEDIERFCADVSPGDNRVHACLSAADDLEPVCSDYLDTVAPPKDDDWGSIIETSFDIFRNFFEDDQPAIFQARLEPPLEEVEEEEEERAASSYEDEALPDQEEPSRSHHHHHHHKATLKLIRLLVLASASLATLVLLFSLLAHLRRKRKEHREKLDFKQKFAPLLVEA
mmetsp:Transcript_8155/g.25146  ORF Transcript_8155/g.25146 Transcript_8155/m.25146 type:complete len:359 (-) Transcript_8155:246-1322(-)